MFEPKATKEELKQVIEEATKVYSLAIQLNKNTKEEHGLICDKLAECFEAINKLVESNNNQNKVLDSLKKDIQVIKGGNANTEI